MGERCALFSVQAVNQGLLIVLLKGETLSGRLRL